MTDLVSGTTRGNFRNLMTDVVVGAIESAFQVEGLAPDVPGSRTTTGTLQRLTHSPAARRLPPGTVVRKTCPVACLGTGRLNGRLRFPSPEAT